MNIFKIYKGIREVGYNYGVPAFFIDCGMGAKYDPIRLFEKLKVLGLSKGAWIVIRGGLKEKGIGIVVDGIKTIGCRAEVEATGSEKMPAWFTKADRWTVWWNGDETFNFTGLRKGQDMLVCYGQNLDEMLSKLGSSDIIDKGVVTSDGVDLDKMFKYKVRVYPRAG